MQSVSAMAGENNIYFQIEYFIVCATRDPQSHSIIVSVLAASHVSVNHTTVTNIYIEIICYKVKYIFSQLFVIRRDI